jgi:hypothetical protein
MSKAEEEWELVEDFAKEIFERWYGPSVCAWVKEVWIELARIDFVRSETLIDTTRSHLVLVSLALIYDEFRSIAFEDGTSSNEFDHLEKAEITDLAIGLLYSRLVKDKSEIDDFLDERELRKTMISSIVYAFRRRIYNALLKIYGDDGVIMEKMYKSRVDVHDIEDEDHDEDDGGAFDMTFSNQAVYAFISQGFER